jgi:hypothetical protein
MPKELGEERRERKLANGELRIELYGFGRGRRWTVLDRAGNKLAEFRTPEAAHAWVADRGAR